MAPLFSFIKRTSEVTPDPLAAQRARVKSLKEQALELARREAAAEKRMPTLTDYFVACETLGEQHAAALASEQVQWGVKVYSDISGLTVDGFLIRQHDLVPPAEIRQKASTYAVGLAKHQNRAPSTLDYLQAVRRELNAQFPVRAA